MGKYTHRRVPNSSAFRLHFHGRSEVIAPCKRVYNSDDSKLMIPRSVGGYTYPEHTSNTVETGPHVNLDRDWIMTFVIDCTTREINSFDCCSAPLGLSSRHQRPSHQPSKIHE